MNTDFDSQGELSAEHIEPELDRITVDEPVSSLDS